MGWAHRPSTVPNERGEEGEADDAPEQQAQDKDVAPASVRGRGEPLLSSCPGHKYLREGRPIRWT